MAKKFMFACMGVLALTVAFHLGAQYGKADTIVDHTATGIVAFESQLGPSVLIASGEVWFCDDSGWRRESNLEPPVPVSQIRFWAPGAFVSTSDELWAYDWVANSWNNCGSPPGVVATQTSTWGQIKAEFKE